MDTQEHHQLVVRVAALEATYETQTKAILAELQGVKDFQKQLDENQRQLIATLNLGRGFWKAIALGGAIVTFGVTQWDHIKKILG